MIEVDDVFLCKACVLLMDGHYNDPLTSKHPEELIAIIKDLQTKNQHLETTLYHMTNKLAEQIANDAAG